MKKNTLSILEAIKRKITKIDDSDKVAPESDNEISQEFEYIDESQPDVANPTEKVDSEEGQEVDDLNQQEVVADQVEKDEESKASDLELEAQIEDNISEAQTEDIPSEEPDEESAVVDQEDSDEDDFDLTFNNDDEQEEEQGIDLSDLDSSIVGDIDFDEESQDQQGVIGLDDDLEDEEDLEGIGGSNTEESLANIDEEDDFEDFSIDEDEEEEKNSEFLRGQDDDPLAQNIEEEDSDLSDIAVTEGAVSDETNPDYQQSMTAIEEEFNPQIEELEDFTVDESFSDDSGQLPDVDPVDAEDFDMNERPTTDDEFFDDEGLEDEDFIGQQDQVSTPDFDDAQEVAEEDVAILDEPEFVTDLGQAGQEGPQDFEDNRQGFSAKSLSDIMQEESDPKAMQGDFDQIDGDYDVDNADLKNKDIVHEDFAQDEVVATAQSNQGSQYNADPATSHSQQESISPEGHIDNEGHTSDEEMNDFLDSVPDNCATTATEPLSNHSDTGIGNKEGQDHYLDNNIDNQVVSHHEQVQQDTGATAPQHQDFVDDEISEDVGSQIDNDIIINSDIAGKVSKSINDLSDAKDMVTKVEDYSKSDMLSQVAFELMKPKLENWFNENLPQLVEKIVREEIKKIVSDNKE